MLDKSGTLIPPPPPAALGRRRGLALILVMLIVSTLLAIGVLFSGAVTAEYRAAVYYRQAIQAEQYCIVGLHRAAAELMYDVWGVNEDRPFVSARYNPNCSDAPLDNLLAMGSNAACEFDKVAYYDGSDGTLQPIVHQSGFWNGEAWVVWAGRDFPMLFPQAKDAEVDGNVWNMDPRPVTRPEKTGGAQRYLSYGQGTVAVTNGSTAVTGTGTSFDGSWPSGTDISINGAKCDIRSVKSPTSLTIWNPWTGSTASGLGWYVAGSGSAAGSIDGSLPGGPMALRTFLAGGKGYAANPRWVNPEAFVSRSAMHGDNFKLYGGVDLNGDGLVNATDHALRCWALWKLKCDAFLPEAMDNNDAFESQLHANDRLHGDRSKFMVASKDVGYEFVSPFIVGDSFYQIFRFDPIHTMCTNISGETGSQENLAAKSDAAGYRYPYERMHLGKGTAALLSDDPAGGLVNINPVNNNYNVEAWTSTPGPGATPEALTWHHINEAKWIYCYDPLDANRRLGRYSVTVMPDCATWNAAALHSGTPDPVLTATSSSSCCAPVGKVGAVGGMLAAIRAGFHRNTGDPCAANLLASVDTGLGEFNALCCYAPIRPEPLPSHWVNVVDTTPLAPAVTYWCPDGSPDSNQKSGSAPADRTRAPEIWGAHGGRAWDSDTGVRSAIYNYLVWLGPYSSRAEFATHLRKACICLPDPIPTGAASAAPDGRACMETEVNTSEVALAQIARSARLLASHTTVHGYYYTLDRFWDRSLLVVDCSRVGSDCPADIRLTTAQCTTQSPTDPAKAGSLPGQKTRNALLRQLHRMECFGGYRTRDGKYRLLDYLFDGDAAPPDYVAFLNNPTKSYYTPAGYGLGPVYGGAGPVQMRSSRREKFMACAVSRTASAQRPDGETAACANGHLVHSPQLSVFHKPVWDGSVKSKVLRTSASDECYDEIAAGCPVCGGKLFLTHVYELGINEIGRFYGKLRTAERPARAAFDLNGPDDLKRPMRHFVELMLSGRYRDDGATNALVRFDMTMLNPDTGLEISNSPGVLADPVTGKPYFSSHLECERRWRASSNAAAPDYAEGLDPEPIFRGLPNKPGDTGGPYSNYLNLHVLVFDEGDHGGRWHDVTWCLDHPVSALNHRTGKPDCYPGDPRLYRRSFCLDDTAPDSARWLTTGLRCDEQYGMPDPDPAHRQADANAWVSIYRKMPVRWHGGDRRDTWQLHYDVKSSSTNAPLGVPGSGLPVETRFLRGLGFDETLRLSNRRAFYNHHDCLYVGDASWLAGQPGSCSSAGFVSSPNTEWPAFQNRDPGQYGIISFDSRFDGSKVALVYGQPSNQIPDYGDSCRIVSYVELTDSAGAPLRISEACNASAGTAEARDRGGNRTMFSWQVRNSKDARGNADGYMCWDLLPMTLNGDVTPDNDPTNSTVGYDPWWRVEYTPDCNWWCSGDDGLSSRRSAQVMPKGYADLGGNLACRNRNINAWNLNVPVRRSAFDGTAAASGNSREAVHESIVRTMHDHCNVSSSRRAYRDKSNAMSTPTGIGRQVSDDDAQDPASATHAGWQHFLVTNAKGQRLTWQDGNGATDPRRKWAGYSWNSWYKFFAVTDLCQALLWNSNAQGPNGAMESIDLLDADQDGLCDEMSSSSCAYMWSHNGQPELVPAVGGQFPGELRQINKLNLNELWSPPTFAGVGWNQSYASFGRKPLKGFHAPSDLLVRHYDCSGSDAPYDLHTTDPGYNLRIMPWDLDADASLESGSFNSNGAYYQRLDPVHCGSSPVYTVFVTGNALDERGEPLSGMRLRATVERTWDGRCNILEFVWLPTDRGFMEQ